MYSQSKHLIHDAINLRYRLSPYMYSLMYRAHVTGLPYFSPMLLEYQQDPKVYDEAENFMLGSGLMVANVLEKGQKVREVYFPQGETFYDFNTFERYEGGTTVQLPVDMASIPMFIRSGQIVVMAGAEDKLRCLQRDQVKHLEIIAAPDKDGSFTLYEDDGVSNDFEQGKFLTTDIKMQAGTTTKFSFHYSGSYESAVEQVKLYVIHHEKCPFYVMVDGVKIEHLLHRAEFEQAPCAWYYSQTRKCVEIKYPAIKRDHKVVISFEPFDMIGM